MEDLTKQQIILLSLLLSFVTSIGTGIITVSLIGEAPDTVTQTINRVVEKTIETVVPKEITIKETNTQTQLVVEKDDLITGSIENVASAIARIYNVDGENRKFFALGLVIRDDGLISLTGNGFVSEYKYLAVYADGTEYTLSLSKEFEPNNNLVFLYPDKFTDEETSFSSISALSGNSVKLGQSVIVVSGEKDTTAVVGRIVSLGRNENGEVDSIQTDVSTNSPGGVLINLSGAVIGYNLSNADSKLQKTYTIADKIEPIVKSEEENPPTNNNP